MGRDFEVTLEQHHQLPARRRDAVAEGIITELARSKTYAVIARNLSFRYRDKPADARQIGDELGVDYLLEGSQQKIGDRLKVTANC